MPPLWPWRQRSAQAAGARAVLTLQLHSCWNGVRRQRCPAAARFPSNDRPSCARGAPARGLPAD
eukprot:1550534-Alexandrium_andersonii.AAC.1